MEQAILHTILVQNLQNVGKKKRGKYNPDIILTPR